MDKIKKYAKYLFTEKPLLGYGILGLILLLLTNFFTGLFIFSIGLYLTFRNQDKERVETSNGTKKCSQCQMDVPLLAKKCPHCQSKIKMPITAGGKIIAFLAIALFISAMVTISNTEITSPTPVATQETQSGNDVAFCAMVGQYLAIVNGDQVSVTDAMVIAGLEVIAEKAQNTRFETTANRALVQGKASDTQGLVASLHELARSCGLEIVNN